jgi:hypothetical protein
MAISHAESPLSFRPWRFPNAASRQTLTTARLNLRTSRKYKLLRAGPRAPLTTRSLAADYLALCRNPLKDIRRWIVEIKPKARSAHAHNSSHRPPAGSFGLCCHALHALSGRMDTQIGGRHHHHHLSSRPGASADQYDQLRSLRAEGGVTWPLAQSYAETGSPTAAPERIHHRLGFHFSIIATPKPRKRQGKQGGGHWGGGWIPRVARPRQQWTAAVRHAQQRSRAVPEPHRPFRKGALGTCCDYCNHFLTWNEIKAHYQGGCPALTAG